MNRKFISKSNFVFRKVLNSEDCLDILKNFIENILDIKIQEIILNPYLQKREKYLPSEENFGIADVRIKTDENEEINVGIQVIDGKYIQTKMLMYYEQIHQNQLEHEDKREFARTITINILDFIYFESFKYDKKIDIKCSSKYVRLEEIELHIIELPKFTYTNSDNLTEKEQWIAYLKGGNNKLLEKIKNKNKYIEKLDNLVEKYWEEEKME